MIFFTGHHAQGPDHILAQGQGHTDQGPGHHLFQAGKKIKCSSCL